MEAAFFILNFVAYFVVPPAGATSDPAQTNFVTTLCGPFAATDADAYFSIVNATIPQLRSDLKTNPLYDASAQARSYVPVFLFFQCRQYLSPTNCLACFDAAAATLVPRCHPANSGGVVLDGCSLAYQSSSKRIDATSNWSPISKCEVTTVVAGDVNSFGSRVQMVMEGLVRDVPRTEKLFGVAEVKSSGQSSPGVFAVGQCVTTEGDDFCRTCLQTSYENLKGCPPASGGRSASQGCFLRYSDQPFFNDTQIALLPISSGTGKRKLIIVISCTAAAAVCLILFILLLLIRRSIRRSRKNKRNLTATACLLQMWEPIRFQYEDLKHATDNFSDTNKLGQGGFSIVYKGTLKSGQVVAVKKLTIGQSEQYMLGFEREVALLSNTRHRNVVTLLGYCMKEPDLLLVYEHMEKGSLNSILFGGEQGSLTWSQRFDVIIGIARGIAYLHEEFYVRIIHRDIKCSNVLLDNSFQPKIGDFGLARSFPENESRLRTILAGTLGYTAPEYFFGGELTEKVDTYSFGILILEIISRRKCTDLNHESYLIEWAWRLYETDALLELVDKTLEPSTSEAEEMKKVIQIGLMCTQPAQLRLSMSEVVTKLMSGGYSRLQLTRPTFLHNTRNPNVDIESPFALDSSINGTLTMSHIIPR